MRIILTIILAFTIGNLYSQCNPNAPVTYNLTHTSVGELYRPNPSAWKGGDTLRITESVYSVVELFNAAGDPCRPLVVVATGFTTPAFRITGNSRYLKIIADTITRNIKVGVFSIVKAHHIEAIGIDCSGGSIGVYCRYDVNPNDVDSWYPNYPMPKIAFRHFYVHGVSGEAFYVGNTQPNGYQVVSPYTGNDTIIPPNRLDSVEVTNCIVDSSDWDGIQLSNVRNGAVIANNTVTNFGMTNQSSQQAGIILGGNSSGDIYNNTVRKGTGNGIEFFGYSLCVITNNFIDSVGFSGRIQNGVVVGDQSYYGNDNYNAIEQNPPHRVNFYANHVKHYQKCEAVRIANYGGTSGLSSVTSNVFCIPSATGNWQPQWLLVSPVGSTVANNVLSCSVTPPEPPTGECNCLIGTTKYIN